MPRPAQLRPGPGRKRGKTGQPARCPGCCSRRGGEAAPDGEMVPGRMAGDAKGGRSGRAIRVWPDGSSPAGRPVAACREGRAPGTTAGRSGSARSASGVRRAWNGRARSAGRPSMSICSGPNRSRSCPPRMFRRRRPDLHRSSRPVRRPTPGRIPPATARRPAWASPHQRPAARPTSRQKRRPVHRRPVHRRTVHRRTVHRQRPSPPAVSGPLGPWCWGRRPWRRRRRPWRRVQWRTSRWCCQSQRPGRGPQSQRAGRGPQSQWPSRPRQSQRLG